jgi:hypothetical protein
MTFVAGVSSTASEGRLYFVSESHGLAIERIEGAPRVPRGPAPEGAVYVGTLAGEPCFAAAATAARDLEIVSLRHLHASLPDEDFTLAMRALGLVAWDRDHRHCGRCGGRTERVRHGAQPRVHGVRSRRLSAHLPGGDRARRARGKGLARAEPPLPPCPSSRRSLASWSWARRSRRPWCARVPRGGGDHGEERALLRQPALAARRLADGRLHGRVGGGRARARSRGARRGPTGSRPTRCPRSHRSSASPARSSTTSSRDARADAPLTASRRRRSQRRSRHRRTRRATRRGST